MGAFGYMFSTWDWFLSGVNAKGWKQSDAQRYVCDLIHTMDSTWPVQEVEGWWGDILEGWWEQRCIGMSHLIAIWVVVSNMFYFQPYLGR